MANTIEQLNRNTFRVLLDGIAAAAHATIGFHGKAGTTLNLPPLPDWKPYEYEGVHVTLQDLVKVSAPVVRTDVDAAIPVSVVKSGTTQADFLITIHNDLNSGAASGTLEIYIERAAQ